MNINICKYCNWKERGNSNQMLKNEKLEDPIEAAILTSPLSQVDTCKESPTITTVEKGSTQKKITDEVVNRKLVYDETFGVIEKSILVMWEKSKSPSKTPNKQRVLPPVRNSPKSNIVNSPSDEFCVPFEYEENMPSMTTTKDADENCPNPNLDAVGDHPVGEDKKKKKKKKGR